MAGRTSRDRGDRNGTRIKTVLTEIGPVDIEVPRDWDGVFEPAIMRKRQRRMDGVVLPLSAWGLTTGEIAAHFAEVYGAKVRKDTISWITDKVIEEMSEWRNASSRSERSSAARTPSRASTAATAELSGPGDTSPPTRPR